MLYTIRDARSVCRLGGVARHPRRVEEETVNFDYAQVKSAGDGKDNEQYNQEDSLVQVVESAAVRKGLPVTTTSLERPILPPTRVTNYLVKSDVELVDGSVIKVSPYEAHTGMNPPRQLAPFMERILVKRRERDEPQPRWKVA